MQQDNELLPDDKDPLSANLAEDQKDGADDINQEGSLLGQEEVVDEDEDDEDDLDEEDEDDEDEDEDELSEEDADEDQSEPPTNS